MISTSALDWQYSARSASQLLPTWYLVTVMPEARTSLVFIQSVAICNIRCIIAMSEWKTNFVSENSHETHFAINSERLLAQLVIRPPCA